MFTSHADPDPKAHGVLCTLLTLELCQTLILTYLQLLGIADTQGAHVQAQSMQAEILSS